MKTSIDHLWKSMVLAGFFCGALFQSAAAEDAEKRIVFIAGGPSHGPGEHEYRAGSLLLARALNEQSGLRVKAEVISGWPEDATVLKAAAAIIVFDSATKSIGSHLDEVDKLAKEGRGVMFLHYAVHPSAQVGEKYYRPWTGAAFESGFSVNPFWIADLEPLPAHPVSRGIQGPVRAYDEFYYNMRFRPEKNGVLDLATATPTRENIVMVNNLWTQAGYEGLNQKQTLLWGTQREDGGRGAGFTGGHYHKNWALDDYRKLVLNAIVWVAGMEVPEGGVKSDPITVEDLNANLDDKGRAANLALPTETDLGKLKHSPVPTAEEHAAAWKARQENRGKAGKEKAKAAAPEAAKAAMPEVPKAAPADAEKSPPNNEAGDAPRVVPPTAFTVPEDLEVTLWATSPMFFNPTNMDTDREGRIWVAEGVNYRKKKNRRPEGDRIVVLEDADKDGKADHSHVFVQDPELVTPLGIAVLGNRIVVSQPPHLIVYTDVDGDLRFDPTKDKRENLLSGFLGNNHDHSLHAVVAGPDGRYYFNQGNTGADFTTREGVRYRVGGPYHEGQKLAGARSDDGRIWTGGFAASMNPDGTGLRMIGHGFRNSYEQCVNSLGDVYQSDNDDPPACRNTWLMEGGFLGFFSRSGMHTWEADRRRGQTVPVAEWRQEDPGTLPPGDVYGAGSPTGVTFYENGALPDKYRGLYLSAEARRQVVFGYYPKPDGAGKKLERFDFFKAAGKTLFRPSDVMVGADGALYVADWFDEGVGGHGTRDDAFSGSIYRIATKGFRPSIDTAGIPPGTELAAEQAVRLLVSPAPNVRHDGLVALKAMMQKGDGAAIQAIEKLAQHENPWIRNRAAWLQPWRGATGVDWIKDKLNSEDADQRILALRVLRNAGLAKADNTELWQKVTRDDSPAVRREAAVMLRDMPAALKQTLVVELLRRYDGRDRVYLEACGLAAEGVESAVWAALRKELDQTKELSWSPAFARITWRLQPVEAVPALLARADATALSFEDRKLAVDSLAFTQTQSAMDAMVRLRKAEPAIAELATAWLLIRATDEWEGFGGRKVLKDEGLYDPEKVVIQEVVMPPKARESLLPPAGEIARLKGDAVKGQMIANRCTMCHRIQGNGAEYGPDLKGWAAQQGVENFIKAVVNPSDTVALGFEGQTVPLNDGRKVEGILISAGDPLTVRSMGGLTQMIPRSMLFRRTAPMNRSLMLSAEEMGLTAQDVADLAAYMMMYK
ncbi:PVC-type heme-binding CxxCH protein [Prosthecobacter sp.]|uniref:PVC-type heme-binding CxxCH protein n=1 Tax=Prosthecobacter sp. TaxID=1965333 RepID=UPI00378456F1